MRISDARGRWGGKDGGVGVARGRPQNQPPGPVTWNGIKAACAAKNVCLSIVGDKSRDSRERREWNCQWHRRGYEGL